MIVGVSANVSIKRKEMMEGSCSVRRPSWPALVSHNACQPFLRKLRRFALLLVDSVAVAGLLTRFSFFRLPIRPLAHSGIVKKVFLKLTAAGTVQDFHPIPFYSHKCETKAGANVMDGLQFSGFSLCQMKVEFPT